MHPNERICHRVLLKSSKDRQNYLKRQQNYIEGTPKITLNKQFDSNIQQVWTDDLRNEPISKLKQLNSDQRAFYYARKLIAACVHLAPRYGHFIINQNMVFFNAKRQIYAWINPQILQNHVKIYLPGGPEGESMMIRSILTYLKLWLKCDYQLLQKVKFLDDLLVKFDSLRPIRGSEEFKPKSPERTFLANRKNSANFQPGDVNYARYSGLKPPPNGIFECRSNRQIGPSKSPGKQFQIEKMQSKPRLGSEKGEQILQHDFQHRTFNNQKGSLNQSVGVSDNKYFPNRTTSNRNHPIVQLINSQDNEPHQYKPNRLLQQKTQAQKIRKLKQSYGGIGDEVNQLFRSNIEGEDEREDEMKKIQQQFGNLLG